MPVIASDQGSRRARALATEQGSHTAHALSTASVHSSHCGARALCVWCRTKFPRGAVGLVHKSPEKRFHDDGRVLNRLMLKVDVLSVGQVGADSVGRVGADHGAPTPATTRVVVQRAAKRGRTE